jgi:hypothetical protein
MTEIIAFNKDIKEGQLFIAKKSTVEGRDKVTLVPVDETDYYQQMDEPTPQRDDSFDDMDGDKAFEERHPEMFEEEIPDPDGAP